MYLRSYLNVLKNRKDKQFLRKSQTNQQIERLIRTKYETTTRIYFNPTQEKLETKHLSYK